MCAKQYENPTMLSKVTAKSVGDVFFETHCIYILVIWAWGKRQWWSWTLSN